MPKFIAYHGKTGAEHQVQFNSLSQQGYRMISLSLYNDSDSPRYAAVWVEKGGSAWAAFHGKSASEYQQFFNSWTEKGYRPTMVTATGNGSDAVFAGVFEKDSTPFTAKHGISKDEFIKQCKWAQDNGFILSCTTVYGTADNPVYAGIWEKNTSNIAWNYSLGDSAADYQNKFNAYTAGWVRPDFVTLSASEKYLAIWHDNLIGDWVAHHNLTSSGYQSKFDQLTSSGFYPICVQAGGEGSGVRFAAIFAKNETPISRKWTVTGKEVPSLSEFDDYVKSLMQKHNVRGGSLAIVKDSKLVFARGYTWAEPGYPITQPTSLFRIASCSKPLTKIAIHQLVEQEKLSLNDHIQRILNLQSPGGGTPADPRLNNVKVEHLIKHLGGWNVRAKEIPQLGFEPMFHDVETAEAFDKSVPVTKYQIASYMTGQQMQFDPGTDPLGDQYSNYGYSLLGQIVENKRPGFNYTEAVKDSIFTPLGVTRPRLGRSLLANQASGEVRYHGKIPYVGSSVMTSDRPWVPGAYGPFNIENMDSHGGWIMAAPDYAKVLAAFDLDDNPLFKKEETAKAVGSLNHNGGLHGTSTVVLRSGKLSFVLFFNQDNVALPNFDQLNDIAKKVSNWPNADLFPTVGIPA